MRLLLIETCSEQGFLARSDSESEWISEPLPGRGTSEHLIPVLRNLFPSGLDELSAVGVVIGPGSFTGVRVGLAAAKGICEALGVRMIALSRLALVAASARSPQGRVLAVLDAGRGEFFCGLYVGGEMRREELLTEVEARELMAEAEPITSEPGPAERLGIPLIEEPGAEAMRRLILARVEASQWSDIAATDANYLRRTDAERLAEAKATPC